MIKADIEKYLNMVSKRMTDISGDIINEDSPIGIIDINNWEWPQGVGLYGLYKYYKLSGSKEYLDYMLNWYEERIKEGIPQRNINTTAPMLTLAYIAEETGNEKYINMCCEWAEWVMNELPRTQDGGFQHVVSGALDTTEQLWDDTLFMTVLFLAKVGSITNNKTYIEESKKQFLVHIKYLFDKNTGLWFHGWAFKEKCNFSGTKWGRGNSWFTAGVVDYLDMIELEDGIKGYLLDTLKAQVDTLAKIQHESGLWHTVLDDEASYLEASASAAFGYGILKAVRKGYIDGKYKEVGMKALKGVIEQIDEEGTVNQVSYGTPIFWEEQKYKEIPICPMTYGQSLTILLLGEALNWE